MIPPALRREAMTELRIDPLYAPYGARSCKNNPELALRSRVFQIAQYCSGSHSNGSRNLRRSSSAARI
jgi:hypothetical protein